MKIRQVGDDLFHVDRQIDMKLIVAFRNFANAPKMFFFLMLMANVPLKVGLILPDFTVSHSYFIP